MNYSHLKYHSPIPRKGMYNNSVKLLLALSIYILEFLLYTTLKTKLRFTLLMSHMTYITCLPANTKDKLHETRNSYFLKAIQMYHPNPPCSFIKKMNNRTWYFV